MKRLPAWLAIFSLISSAFTACGEKALTAALPLENTDCVGVSEPVAHILVGDGFIQRQCGCLGAGETPGTYFHPSSDPAAPKLYCTIAAGTTVFFHYLGTMRAHQILSTGTPSFASSGPSNPKEDGDLTLRVHAVKMSTIGTFTFHDGFDNAISGTIQVQ